MGLKMSGMSMGMTTGDFNNDGHLDIIASNVTLTAGERLFNMASHVDFEDARYSSNFADLQQSYTGILLYQNQGNYFSEWYFKTSFNKSLCLFVQS